MPFTVLAKSPKLSHYIPPAPFEPPEYTSDNGMECGGMCCFSYRPDIDPDQPFTLKYRNSSCPVGSHHA